MERNSEMGFWIRRKVKSKRGRKVKRKGEGKRKVKGKEGDEKGEERCRRKGKEGEEERGRTLGEGR